MVFTTLLLLALLFLAAFFIYFPNRKLLAWFQSFVPIQTASKSAATKKEVIKKDVRSVMTTKREEDPELKRVFATFDKNSDGFITKQELKESLKNIRVFMSDEEVEEMVKKVDANGDGLIDFSEFCLLCQGQSIMSGGEAGSEVSDVDQEEKLKEAFDVFDKDKDGLISVEELGVVLCSLGLREGNRVEACKEMVKKVDKDGDGMVNFDEFKMMMKGGRLLTAF
ncbi:calmodulin-like protein 3 [Argentina anserina]|uniref:calmodulin-like protein 3 n=1 Tax=Argentina anserina TaxID=57926 RepID=UPI0021763A65|nr:calmodulin-like protein 3 [Potentilla anserina]